MGANNSNEIQITFYLDNRKVKKSGDFPIKLRIYEQRKPPADLVYIGLDVSEALFKGALSNKPKKKEVDLRVKLDAVWKRAREIINSMAPYNREEFKKIFYRKDDSIQNIIYHYETAISDFIKRDRVRTADTYQNSLKSILIFAEQRHGKKVNFLNFSDITTKFLNDYEDFMVNQGKSSNTISIYTRSLRAIFRKAIDEDKVITEDLYPFGRNKYFPPSTVRAKRGINDESLKKLREATPILKEQIEARNYWFILYYCAGMNPADLANMKRSDYNGKALIYYRTKTKNTKRRNLTPVITPLVDDAIRLIEELSCPISPASEFLFPIFYDGIDEAEKVRLIKNFSRSINHNINKLAQSLGITEKVICSSARNTFVTRAIKMAKASLSEVSHLLNHSDVRVTQGYVNSFEDDELLAIINKATAF